jgi:hypothetical protein
MGKFRGVSGQSKGYGFLHFEEEPSSWPVKVQIIPLTKEGLLGWHGRTFINV